MRIVGCFKLTVHSNQFCDTGDIYKGRSRVSGHDVDERQFRISFQSVADVTVGRDTTEKYLGIDSNKLSRPKASLLTPLDVPM